MHTSHEQSVATRRGRALDIRDSITLINLPSRHLFLDLIALCGRKGLILINPESNSTPKYTIWYVSC